MGAWRWLCISISRAPRRGSSRCSAATPSMPDLVVPSHFQPTTWSVARSSAMSNMLRSDIDDLRGELVLVVALTCDLGVLVPALEVATLGLVLRADEGDRTLADLEPARMVAGGEVDVAGPQPPVARELTHLHPRREAEVDRRLLNHAVPFDLCDTE